MELLTREQVVAAPLDEAFAFFGDPWNLERITPPWLRFRVLEAPDELQAGSLLRYRLHLFGIPITWRTRIAAWEPPHRFVDVQVAGPYQLWKHTHELEAHEHGTLIRDRVAYRAPFAFAAQPVVERCLKSIFDYRARVMRDVLG